MQTVKQLLIRFTLRMKRESRSVMFRRLFADKTSDNGADRIFRCQFNLKSLKYSNTATYYLVIFAEQGAKLLQREPVSD